MPLQRPTLPELIARSEADLDAEFEAGALSRSDRQALARTLAGTAHGQYGWLEFHARQALPDTTEAEFAERWGDIWKVIRKAAAEATGAADFTGSGGAVIPKDTVLLIDDLEYTTDAEATIAGGVASANVTAREGGADGNAAAGETLTFATPEAGVTATATVGAGGLTGGTDLESEADYLARRLLRMQKPPRGGHEDDYVFWALEIAGVTRAWAFRNRDGAGTVAVFFVMDDKAGTIIPDAAEIQTVQDYIETPGHKPAPATATVYAPVAVPLDFTIQLTPNTAAVQAAVQAELEDMLRQDSSPGGSILISKINEAVSRAEGETDHAVNVPAGTVVHAANEIATMGAITWV